MKTTIGFAILIMGITALPQPEEFPVATTNRNLVERTIVKAIEDVSQGIKDSGLDPLYIDIVEFYYGLPVPVLFNAAGSVKDINSSGASNILIHRINYSHVNSRLTFDLEVPHVSFSVGGAKFEATLFGSKFEAEASGKIDIKNIRIAGEIRFNVGLVSGITVRSIKVDFNLGGIHSDITIVIQGKDYSDNINYFLNSTVVEKIDTFGPEINELIEIIMTILINSSL